MTLHDYVIDNFAKSAILKIGIEDSQYYIFIGSVSLFLRKADKAIWEDFLRELDIDDENLFWEDFWDDFYNAEVVDVRCELYDNDFYGRYFAITIESPWRYKKL
jgi:hypothetical protein